MFELNNYEEWNSVLERTNREASVVIDLNILGLAAFNYFKSHPSNKLNRRSLSSLFVGSVIEIKEVLTLFGIPEEQAGKIAKRAHSQKEQIKTGCWKLTASNADAQRVFRALRPILPLITDSQHPAVIASMDFSLEIRKYYYKSMTEHECYTKAIESSHETRDYQRVAKNYAANTIKGYASLGLVNEKDSLFTNNQDMGCDPFLLATMLRKDIKGKYSPVLSCRSYSGMNVFSEIYGLDGNNRSDKVDLSSAAEVGIDAETIVRARNSNKLNANSTLFNSDMFVIDRMSRTNRDEYSCDGQFQQSLLLASLLYYWRREFKHPNNSGLRMVAIARRDSDTAVNQFGSLVDRYIRSGLNLIGGTKYNVGGKQLLHYILLSDRLDIYSDQFSKNNDSTFRDKPLNFINNCIDLNLGLHNAITALLVKRWETLADVDAYGIDGCPYIKSA